MGEIREHRIQIPEPTPEELAETEAQCSSPSLLMSLIPESCIPKRRLMSRVSVTNYQHHHHNNNHRNTTARRAFRFFVYKKWSLVFYGFCFLVFIFFFLLWWFSSSAAYGGLPFKDGRIVEVVSDVKSFYLNNNSVELRHMPFMTDAAPPNPNMTVAAPPNLNMADAALSDPNIQLIMQ